MLNNDVRRCSVVFCADTDLSAAAADEEEHGFSSTLQESSEFKL